MLKINFHQGFVPERRLVRALLQFAALGKQGTYREIADETGIPMGEFSGKVPSIIDYARGMGLVGLLGPARSSIRKPVLTPFGRVVLSTDKNLGEELTQWLVHMNLCRGDIGAEAWHAAFAKGRRALTSRFTKRQLEYYLTGIFGPGRDRTGPLVRTYADDAALKRAGVVTEDAQEPEKLVRRQAPIRDTWAMPYSAIILTLMEVFFPGEGQVTVSDFNDKTLWFDVCLWDESDVERVLSIVERKPCLAVDRQMRPWILERRTAADNVWPRIFEDLV